MIVTAVCCPHCQKPDHVVRHGTTDSGTARCRCRACNKTFSPNPKSRQPSTEKKRLVERLLAERLSQRAIARGCKVGYKTIRQVAEDAPKNSPTSRTA